MNMDLGHASPCSPSRRDSETRAQRKGKGGAPVSGAPREPSPSGSRPGAVSRETMLLGNFLPVMLLL